MKKIYIVAGIMVVVAIGLLMSAAKDMGTFGTFAEAEQSGAKVKISGQLSKDKEMHYNPEEDPNYFSFYITDSQGDERKVVLRAGKPQDFELSEQIVVTGTMQNDVFLATDMLMKCPSKYKDDEIYVKSQG